MSLGRRRAEVVIDLPDLTAAELPSLAQADQRGLRERGIWMQCRSDGTLRARVLGGRYHVPPLLRATAEDLPTGLRLRGEARESAAMLTAFCMLAGVAAFLTAMLAVLLSRSAASDLEGVLVCAIGAPVMAAIALLIAWLRPREFQRDVAELHERLPAVLLGARDMTGS